MVLLSVLLAFAAFPMAGGNAQRTSYQDLATSAGAHLPQWTALLHVEGEALTQPILDSDDNVYATAGARGHSALVSLDRTGVERWRWEWFTQDKSHLSVPVLAPGNAIVMGFRDGWLRCWDRDSGGLRWEHDLSGDREDITCAPVIDRAGFLYVYLRNRPFVIKVDSRTGQERWRIRFADGDPIGHGTSPSLSVDESTLYIGRTGHGKAYLYALSTADGSHRWAWSPDVYDDHTFTWPLPVVGPDGTVYIQDEYFVRVYAIRDLGDHYEHVWTFAREGECAPRTAALTGGVLYTAYGSDPPTAVAIDTATGAALWERTLDTGTTISGVLATREDVLLSVNGANEIRALRREDGEPRWSFPTGGTSIAESPALRSDGTVYIGTQMKDGAAAVLTCR